MSEHHATIDWKRETPDFAYETYNRDHDWTFDAGVTVRGSAAPAYKGSESCVDPEEAFVASLSSCHMLTFLALAARKRYVVDAYRDEAVGILAKDVAGNLETLAPSPGIIAAWRGGVSSSFPCGMSFGHRETCPARSGL
jgi:organic hydroperoxide reductase OsmC/OhrA